MTDYAKSHIYILHKKGEQKNIFIHYIKFISYIYTYKKNYL